MSRSCDARRAPRARRSARRLPGAVSGGYDSESFCNATHLLLDADGIDGGGSLRDNGGAAGGLAGASRDAGGERNLAGLSEDSHGFRVCVIMIVRENRARPTLASPTRALPAWRSEMACRRMVISRSVFISTLLIWVISIQIFKKKTRSSALMKTTTGTEERRRKTKGTGRGVLRARKRQVRRTQDAAPFRDTRTDTPRAQEKAHTREARLGLSVSNFRLSRATRAPARPTFAPRRDRIARGGRRELLAKPTKHAPRWLTTRRGTRPRRTSSP